MRTPCGGVRCWQGDGAEGREKGRDAEQQRDVKSADDGRKGMRRICTGKGAREERGKRDEKDMQVNGPEREEEGRLEQIECR